MLYTLNGKGVEVINVIRRRNSIALRVVSDSKIEIYSPYPLKDDDIYNFLSRHKRFIARRICTDHQEEDTLHLLGNKYKYRIVQSDFNSLYFDDYLKEVRIYTKRNDDKYIFRLVNEYYKGILIDIVNKNIEEIKIKMNIHFNIDFEYKRVNSYYGECFNKKGLVILNTKLAKYEMKYILSVIYHELAHFYYQNHQDKFYKLLEDVFPNYKRIQKELRSIKYNDKY